MIEQTCLFCGYRIDTGHEITYREGLPQSIHSRLAVGARRDKDGRWFHVYPWQCVLAYEIHNAVQEDDIARSSLI